MFYVFHMETHKDFIPYKKILKIGCFMFPPFPNRKRGCGKLNK